MFLSSLAHVSFKMTVAEAFCRDCQVSEGWPQTPNFETRSQVTGADSDPQSGREPGSILSARTMLKRTAFGI
jgi:hypothetical protein